jgi:hypothetical protein
MKPNNKLLYVNKQSNHPPQIIKSIPKGINNRLSTISSDDNVFARHIQPYQQALAASGYDFSLKFRDTERRTSKQDRKNRKRNITWYNPPYSKSVSTNIGKQFLKIIDQEFPSTHVLHSIFNRNTVKVSYSCMRNVKAIVNTHNKKIMKNAVSDERPLIKECNCRKPASCPMEGKCLTKSIIYQATVTTTNKTESYIGSTACEFKTRYNNHTASFRHSNKCTSTELSKYIWSLKDSNTDYTLKWSIITKAPACKNGNSTCGLCITEKFYIIFQPSMATLNDRRALVSACRHSSKYLLSNS